MYQNAKLKHMNAEDDLDYITSRTYVISVGSQGGRCLDEILWPPNGTLTVSSIYLEGITFSPHRVR